MTLVELCHGVATDVGLVRPVDEDASLVAPPQAGTAAVGAMDVEEPGEPAWLLADLGDSPADRSCPGVLDQGSVDHSLVRALVSHGVSDLVDVVGWSDAVPHDAARPRVSLEEKLGALP